MKILYFDCFSGASGDKVLGALVDGGVAIEDLRRELGKLKLSGYQVDACRTVRNAITGTKVTVRVKEQHVHRHLADIVAIIDGSDLHDKIKLTSRRVFETLAEAEAKIHNTGIDKIHFHEVGALDAIIDIVGAVIGIHLLAVDAVHSSPIHLGRGFVDCQHGKIPVPAPATLEILKDVPVIADDIECELTTPTGAAILKCISCSFGLMPPMKLRTIGYGAGSHDLEIPNLLRVVLGDANTGPFEQDQVRLIETNIDDMNPELVGYVLEKLMATGALDAYVSSVTMKKSRPGMILHVLTPPDRVDDILSVIFEETTSLGVRMQQVERRKLDREIKSIKTRHGEVRVKIGKLGDAITNIAPEYEDCREVALREGIPLKEVYEEVIRAARKTTDP